LIDANTKSCIISTLVFAPRFVQRGVQQLNRESL
jgi:hypothetical protein